MNKRLLALLMAGTITISGVPFSAMAATEEPAAVVEEERDLSVLEVEASSGTTYGLAADSDFKTYTGVNTSAFVEGIKFAETPTKNTENSYDVKVTGTAKYVKGTTGLNVALTKDFYFPLAITVPNSNEEKFTITVTDDVIISNNVFTEEDGQYNKDNIKLVNNKLVYLVDLAAVTSNKITVKVDFDGTGTYYDAVTYIFDLTNISRGYESNATFATMTDTEITQSNDTTYGKKKVADFVDGSVSYTIGEKKGGKYPVKVTGSVKKQADGKYILPVAANIVNGKEGIVTKFGSNDAIALGVTKEVYFVDASSGGTVDVSIKISTSAEYSETIYTLDLSGLKQLEEAPMTLRNVTSNEIYQLDQGLAGANGENHAIENVVEGGLNGLTFEYNAANKTYKVKGTLKAVKENNTSVYYLPFAIDVKGAVKGTTTLKFGADSATQHEGEAFVFCKKITDNSNKAIELDMDGNGANQAITGYTLDLSELKLGDGATTATFRAPSTEEVTLGYVDKAVDEYVYGGAEGLIFKATGKKTTTGSKKNLDIIKVTGSLKLDASNNYFLPLAVDINETAMSGANVKLTVNGSDVETDIAATGYFKLNKTQIDGALAAVGTNDEYVLVTVDADGANASYMPKAYALDLSGISIGQITPVNFTQPTDAELQKNNSEVKMADVVSGNLTYTVSGKTIKVTGKLKPVKVADVSVNNNKDNLSPSTETAYYLPITVTIPNGTDKSVISCDGFETFKTTDTFFFAVADKNTGERVLTKTITVDFDGFNTGTVASQVGEQYAKDAYTFDISELQFYVEGTELEAAAGANIVLDNAAGTVYGAAIGNGTSASATVAEFKKVLSNPAGDLEVVEPSGNVLADGANVYSGCKVILKDANDAKIDEATIIIKGTMSTNGKISALDLARFGKFFSNFDGCSDLEKNVYDMNSNGKVDALDLAAFGMAFGQLQ